MLVDPALLQSPLNASTDDVVALNNGRDLGVDDLLQIDAERMQITQVISANNYKVARPAVKQIHTTGTLVYNLPNPTRQDELNAAWVAPPPGGWFPIGGVWVHGGLPAPILLPNRQP